MADRAIEHSAPRPDTKSRTFRMPALALTGAQRTVLAMVATLCVVFAVQAPTLGHYFFNDDFVPLADIASRSTGGYIKDLLLLRDLTPNWRFVTGLVYLAEYRAFYLNPVPYMFVNVALHTATAGLLFWLLRRATGSDWAALFAACLFGVAAASVPTVGQITALNNVLAGFFATLTLTLLFEALDRDTLDARFFAAAVAAYTLAIASNESAAVSAPVLALIVLWKARRVSARWSESRELFRMGTLVAPFAVLGSAALIGFGTCGCTEAELYSRDNVIDNLWMYLGRLLYPVGLEFPGHTSTAHLVAGSFVIALALLALIRGPALARIAAVFLFLAVAPYLPIDIWSAQRYTYLASIPFAMLAALYAAEVARYATRLSPALLPAVAALAIAGIALNGWQTVTENAAQADASDRWRQLVTTVDHAFPEVPERSTVYVRGGPITDELAQCAVMPAIGEVLWGNAKLFTLPPEQLGNYRARPAYSVYVADYVDGRLVPQEVQVASAAELRDPAIFLLPHVSPEAGGNVCALDTPLLP
jgi:hypothetical protein